MMKTNLTKIISSIAIPLMVAGGLYFSTPEYSYAGNNKKQTQEENDLVKKGGPLIKAIDKLSKTGVGQIIDHGRKDVENWAVKQGTGKTLDELENEAHNAIKSFGQDTSTSPKKETNSYTPSQEKPYTKDSQKTTTTPSEKGWDPTILRDAVQKKVQEIRSLDENKIISSFQNKINDSENTYDLEDIKWEIGKFTAPWKHEALVKFYDKNQGQATGPSEVWLLRNTGGKWEADRKLADNHSTDFKTVDVKKDGKLEILLSGSGGNQGYFVTSTQLISLDGETIKVLYSNEEHSNASGTYSLGEDLSVNYEVQFVDLDNDGILEIVELKKTRTYTGTKLIYFGDDIEGKTSTKTIETIYKLQGDKYVSIKSSEKLSDIERIVRKLNLVYDNCKDYATDALKSCKNVYDAIINLLKDTTSTVTGFFIGKDYIEYNAKKGDTLSIISKNKTGDWKNWKQILEYNKKHNYKNFDENLNIGEKVYIPKTILKK